MSKLFNPSLFDLYGTRPELKFKGQSNSYSAIGLLSTLIVTGFFVWATIINASELFQKESPSLTTAKLPGVTINSPIELTPEVFEISFGLINAATNTFYIDPSIYTVEAALRNDPSDPTTDIPLDIEPCVPEYMRDSVSSTGTMWCFSKKQTQVSKIEFKSKQKSFVMIEFRRCNPTTSTVTCKPSVIIDTYLKASLCARAVSDWKIDPFNYKEPLQKYYKQDWNGLVLTQTKATYIYLTEAEFTSDNGWLLEDSKTQNVMTIGQVETDSGDITSTLCFYRFVLASSGDKDVYFRSYIKIQDVLAQIGSLCSTFMFFLGFVVLPYASLKMYEDFANKIYGRERPIDKKKEKLETVEESLNQETTRRDNDFSESRIENSNSSYSVVQARSFIEGQRSRRNLAQTRDNSKKSSSRPLEIVTIDNVPFAPSHQTDHNNDSTIRSIWKKKNKKISPGTSGGGGGKEWANIRIGYLEYLWSFIRPNAKMKALEKASEEIDEQLDFLSIYKKLSEVDRLKMCLLTNDQRVLFNYLNRINLDCDNQTEKEEPTSWTDKILTTVQISEAYHNIKKLAQKTVLDKNLLELYEKHKKNSS